MGWGEVVSESVRGSVVRGRPVCDMALCVVRRPGLWNEESCQEAAV